MYPNFFGEPNALKKLSGSVKPSLPPNEKFRTLVSPFLCPKKNGTGSSIVLESGKKITKKKGA